MERLNKEGLRYYTQQILSRIKGAANVLMFGVQPTVKVRPSNYKTEEGRPPVYLYLEEGGWHMDGYTSGIQIKIKSAVLSFTIKCDSMEAAEHIINSGKYSLRLSYLSRKYGYTKWVCPSNYPSDEPTSEKLQDWSRGTIWDKIPINPDTCSTDPLGNIVIQVGLVRDLLCASRYDEEGGYYIPLFTAPNSPDNGLVENKYIGSDNCPYIERSLLLGSEAYPSSNIRCFRNKPIHFKGVIPYLLDTGQEVSIDTIKSAPSNAYSCKLKASVWCEGLELPGASTGTMQVTKKNEVILFTYKEDSSNYK